MDDCAIIVLMDEWLSSRHVIGGIATGVHNHGIIVPMDEWLSTRWCNWWNGNWSTEPCNNCSLELSLDKRFLNAGISNPTTLKF